MTGKEPMEVVALGESDLDDSGIAPHGFELDVRRQLLAEPRLRFNSLVVRRIDEGVCLEGVVETDADRDDVDRLAETVAGVSKVLNRLVVRRPGSAPPKG